LNAKVKYLCNRNPGFLLMNNNAGVCPPLNQYLWLEQTLNLKTISIMCETDPAIVTQIFSNQGMLPMLPLHLLLINKTITSNISVEADCFRYLLNLYPAAAGINDVGGDSPYDIAIREQMDIYFIRLLLNADPTIEPDRRHNLNYEARREAMFLAFRAISKDKKASIWAKLRYESQDLLMHTISYL
jgi:hypothetical protein